MTLSLRRLSISNEVANHPIVEKQRCEPAVRRTGLLRARRAQEETQQPEKWENVLTLLLFIFSSRRLFPSPILHSPISAP